MVCRRAFSLIILHRRPRPLRPAVVPSRQHFSIGKCTPVPDNRKSAPGKIRTCLLQFLSQNCQKFRMQRIIRVKKGDILPVCRIKSAVSRPRDALLRGQQTDPPILRRQLRRKRRTLVLRAIVHQQQLPVRVRLPQHRLRRVRQRSRRVTVWNNDRALPHNFPLLFLARKRAPPSYTVRKFQTIR